MNYEPDKITDAEETLQHWGMKGMKWKKKKTPLEQARDARQRDSVDNSRSNAHKAFKSSKMLSEWYERFKNKTMAQEKQSMAQQEYQSVRSYSEKMYKEKQAKQGALNKIGNAFGKATSKVIGSANGAKNKFFTSKLWDGGFNKAMGEQNQRASLQRATNNLYNIDKKVSDRKKKITAAQRSRNNTR